uniref:Uncharacterized protein n=1 Tax=Rhizophora mucronata TaxID=61149 RepID=A0A2P2QWY7_RHIMU
MQTSVPLKKEKQEQKRELRGF